MHAHIGTSCTASADIKSAGSSQNSFLGSSASLLHATHPMTICVPEPGMYLTYFTAVACPHPMSLVHLHLAQKQTKM